MLHKLAGGIDGLLHVVGILVVICITLGYLQVTVPVAIAWLTVALVGLPYPGLHDVWRKEEREESR